MKVSGERYYRVMDGGQTISRHLSIEECMESSVEESRKRGKGRHKFQIVPPLKTIEVHVE